MFRRIFRKKERDPLETITTIVMFVDIVDYTTISNLLSRESFALLHDVFDEVSEKAVKKFDARIVKKIGDAYMLQFKSGSSAIHCARYLQDSFKEHNTKHPEIPINIRIGINKGPALVRHGDLFGTSVNIASRLESMGSAGDILFSDGIKEILNDEFKYEFLGLKKIKGLDYRINVYRISREKTDEKQVFLNDVIEKDNSETKTSKKTKVKRQK